MKGGFDEFRDAVFRDPGLMRLLLEEPDNTRFPALVERLAAERGFEVPAAEVMRQLRAGRQAWHLRKI